MLRQNSTRAFLLGGVLSLTAVSPHAVLATPRAAQTHTSLQPFAQQVRQVETSLAYLGQPLAPADQDTINQAIGSPDESAAISKLERVLDTYTLAVVEINPERRVKVQPGGAKPQ